MISVTYHDAGATCFRHKIHIGDAQFTAIGAHGNPGSWVKLDPAPGALSLFWEYVKSPAVKKLFRQHRIEWTRSTHPPHAFMFWMPVEVFRRLKEVSNAP